MNCQPKASEMWTIIPLGVTPSGGDATYVGIPWIVVVVPRGFPIWTVPLKQSGHGSPDILEEWRAQLEMT
jgi:hypothetical protein